MIRGNAKDAKGDVVVNRSVKHGKLKSKSCEGARKWGRVGNTVERRWISISMLNLMYGKGMVIACQV